MLNPRKIQDLQPPAPTMSANNGCIYIPVPSAHDVRTLYDIELSRIKSPEELLGWVTHLASKPWMSAARLKEFIKLAARLKGYRLK